MTRRHLFAITAALLVAISGAAVALTATNPFAEPTKQTVTGPDEAAAFLQALQEGAYDETLDENERVLRVVELASRQQVAQLGLEWSDHVDLPGHTLPSTAMRALSDTLGGEIGEEQEAALAELDALPEELRDALTGVINAFHALDLAAKNVYQDADLELLQTLEKQGADTNDGGTLEEAGAKLTEIFAARLALVESSLLLKQVLEEVDDDVPSLMVPMGHEEDEHPEVDEGGVCINCHGGDATYTEDYILLIDTSSANKKYHNNAGGHDSEERENGASALIDFFGSNEYGDPDNPRSKGVNGGAYSEGDLGVLVGNLLSLGGQDSIFTAGDLGVNGGIMKLFRSSPFAPSMSGFLLSVGGDDKYIADGDGGTNGGTWAQGNNMPGLLLDLMGEDYYEDGMIENNPYHCLKDLDGEGACETGSDNSCWDCTIIGKGLTAGFHIDLSLPGDIDVDGLVEDLGAVESGGDDQIGLRREELAMPFELSVNAPFEQYETCFMVEAQPEDVGENATLRIGEEGGLSNGCVVGPGEAWLMLGDQLGSYEVKAFIRPLVGDQNETGDASELSETFTAEAVALDSLEIHRDGDSCASCQNLTQVETLAGETLAFVAVGFSKDDEFIPQVKVTWDLDGVGGIGDSSEEDPMRPRVEYTSELVTDNPDVITARRASDEGEIAASIDVEVTPAELEVIRVWDQPDGQGEEIESLSIPSGQSIELHAAGYDAFDNFRPDEEVTWEVDEAIGSLDPEEGITTTFTAGDETGTGTITVDHDDADEVEIKVQVITDALDALEIRDAPDGEGEAITDIGPFTAGNTTLLYAAGYDQFGNYIQDFNLGNIQGFEWELDPPDLGTFNETHNEFNFTVERATEGGSIQAVFQNGAAIESDPVQVARVHPASPAQLGFTATTPSPPVAGEPFSIDVRIEDPFGNHNETAIGAGETRVHLALSEGSTALNGTMEKDSGDEGTTRFQDLEYTTAEIITIAANATIDTDDGGLEIEGIFEIEVVPNALDHLQIRDAFGGQGSFSGPEDPFIVVAGSTFDLVAAGYDEFGNYRQDTPVTWSVEGVHTDDPPDDVVSMFEYQSETTGDAVVKVGHADVEDVTAFIKVVAGALEYVLILDAPGGEGKEVHGLNSLTAGTEIPIFVAEFDEHDNWIRDANIEWSVDPPERGFFNRGGDLFTPGKIGEGEITPHHPDVQEPLASIPVEVEFYGPPGEFVFLTDPGNYTAGDTWAPIEVQVEDGFGNHVEDDSNTEVTLRPGTGYEDGLEGEITRTVSKGNVSFDDVRYMPADEIWIVAEDDGNDDADIRASHGPYRISPAPLDFIVVRDAPDNNGSPVDAIDDRAGEPASLFAAGYDRFGNYREDVPVEWNATVPGLGSFNPSGGPTTTFTPAQATTGGVFAEHPDGPFYTIAVDTRPGPLDHLLIRPAPDGGGEAVETLTIHAGKTTELYAAGYDAFENFVGDVDASWRLDPPRLGSLKPTEETRNTTFTASEGGTGRIVVDAGELQGDLELPIRVTADIMPPQAVIGADCSGFECTFDATGSLPGTADIEEYRWDLGDGTTERGEAIEHTYREPGDYEIVLNVTDANGRTHEARQSASVAPPPEAQVQMEVTTRPTEPLPGEAITATATIENVGSVALLQFSVHFLVDDALVREQAYPRLEADETMNLSATWSARPGNQTLQVEIPGHVTDIQTVAVADRGNLEFDPLVEESSGPAAPLIVFGLLAATLVPRMIRYRPPPRDLREKPH